MIESYLNELKIQVFVNQVRDHLLKGQDHTMIFENEDQAEMVLPKVTANLPFEFGINTLKYKGEYLVEVYWQ